jgi:hypothetical protein
MDFKLWNHKILTINLFKTDSIIGIGSKTHDNKHILHLDLDDKTEIESIRILKDLQYKYALGTAFLLKSSDYSYHGIFLDKLRFDEMIKIQKEVNLKHGCISEMKKESTIRLSSKFGSFISFVSILISKNKEYEQSLSHYNAFINHFKLEHINKWKKYCFPMLDLNDTINIYCYEKRLRIW